MKFRKKLTQEEVDRICNEHKKWLDDPTQGERADFYWKDISYLDLSNRSLQQALFISTWMTDTDLSNSCLSYAYFSWTDLFRSKLCNVRATKAIFIECSLDRTDCEKAKFSQSDFQDSSFVRANLCHTMFSFCDCFRVNFLNAYIYGTSFWHTNLDDAWHTLPQPQPKPKFK